MASSQTTPNKKDYGVHAGGWKAVTRDVYLSNKDTMIGEQSKHIYLSSEFVHMPVLPKVYNVHVLYNT